MALQDLSLASAPLFAAAAVLESKRRTDDQTEGSQKVAHFVSPPHTSNVTPAQSGGESSNAVLSSIPNLPSLPSSSLIPALPHHPVAQAEIEAVSVVQAAAVDCVSSIDSRSRSSE